MTRPDADPGSVCAPPARPSSIDAAVLVRHERDGRLLRLTLNRPKANILDGAMIAALERALVDHLDDPHLLAVMIEAEGPDFSFGASIEEHRPTHCADMLHALHGLLLRILGSRVPVLCAVRGRCLGGGFELALAAHLRFVAPAATFAAPEIRLGVFAPGASCLLPELIGPSRAFDLLVSGRGISGCEAHAMGLADAVDPDPSAAVLQWVDTHLAPKSACALRHAVTALRRSNVERIRTELFALERLYLDELMNTHDAREGLDAFSEKRQPRWEDR